MLVAVIGWSEILHSPTLHLLAHTSDCYSQHCSLSLCISRLVVRKIVFLSIWCVLRIFRLSNPQVKSREKFAVRNPPHRLDRPTPATVKESVLYVAVVPQSAIAISHTMAGLRQTPASPGERPSSRGSPERDRKRASMSHLALASLWLHDQ